MPSAVEYVNVERTTVQLRQKPAQAAAVPNSSNGQYHPMTRHTLQVLRTGVTRRQTKRFLGVFVMQGALHD